jgi:Chromate transporter
MSEAVQDRNLERPVSLAALFIAFLKVSMCGIGGGGLVWARRIAVDQRQWITDLEFADIVSLCQFLPGAEHRRHCRLYRSEDAGHDRHNRGTLRLSRHPVGGTPHQ